MIFGCETMNCLISGVLSIDGFITIIGMLCLACLMGFILFIILKDFKEDSK